MKLSSLEQAIFMSIHQGLIYVYMVVISDLVSYSVIVCVIMHVLLTVFTLDYHRCGQ